MGTVQLPDELQGVIEREVAEGRAASTAALLEGAVLRVLEDARAEDEEIAAVVEAGLLGTPVPTTSRMPGALI